jgi:hypothetical protein
MKLQKGLAEYMRANATILDPRRFGRGILHVPENAATGAKTVSDWRRNTI